MKDGVHTLKTKISATRKSTLAFFLMAASMNALAADPGPTGPWTKFVKVEGQSEPVPEEWLKDEEARIAYSLKLPDSVPKPVPFDFAAAARTGWLPGRPSADVQYFFHLCNTEAGEWIFRKEANVEGLYFARPQKAPASGVLTEPYAPEMPWIQRWFVLQGNPLSSQGGWFVYPPIYNYKFIEQPRRDLEWQSAIRDPYVRIFGLTHEQAPGPDGKPTVHLKQKSPMQVVGIPSLSARYGYTWRGLKRLQDRENGIAGGELLIYDLQTKEVLAVRRQFLKASRNPRGEGKTMWEVAASCREPEARTGEFSQFAFDVLTTKPPSSTKP
ncbi:hypothetical protein [uncultured Ramlibacter sp.]|uniref:hypothetical protein n=1 Tax=uncultured Ramlibacter sp. TaxID=260755 RepID=UPI0026216F45|nr:hypothetical protein [uncultured Ramlibacter sp.]